MLFNEDEVLVVLVRPLLRFWRNLLRPLNRCEAFSKGFEGDQQLSGGGYVELGFRFHDGYGIRGIMGCW